MPSCLFFIHKELIKTSSIPNMDPATQTKKRSDKKCTIIVQKYPKYITGRTREDDDKVLDCFICCVKQNWKEHKISLQHKSNLQYFLQNFEELPDDFIKCKLCNNQIFKSSLKKHASKIHKLIPWYRPHDEFISYFKNFIKPADGTYDCLLCDVKLKSWNLALNHIKCIKHRELWKNCIKEDINEADLTTALCKKLITNCIFTCGASRLQCQVCNFIIKEYSAADEHIADETHKKNLSTNNINPVISLSDSMSFLFKNLKICDSKNCAGDNSAGTSNPESRASTSSGYESTKNANLIDNNSDGDDDDTKTTDSKNSLSSEIDKALKPIDYFVAKTIDDCHLSLSYAKSSTEQLKSIHIDKHQQQVLKSGEIKIKNDNPTVVLKTQIEDKKNNEVKYGSELEEQYVEIFKNYIFVCNNNYFCNLCKNNISLPLSTHINDSVHLDLLGKQVPWPDIFDINAKLPNFCELLSKSNLFQNDIRKLYCYTCQCSVVNWGAEDHILGKNHTKNNKKLFDTSISMRPDQLILPLPESKDDFVKYFENFIEKSLDYYHCCLCNIYLSSSSEVTTHMKNKKHKNLVMQKRKKTNNNIINTLYLSELGVRNGVFQDNLGQLECFSCQSFYSVKNVEEHINSQEHKTQYEFRVSSVKAKINPERTLSKPEVISNSYELKAPSDKIKIVPKIDQLKSEVFSNFNELKISSEKPKIKAETNLVVSNCTLPAGFIKSNITPTNRESTSTEKLTKLENLILRFFENYIYISDNDYFCNLCTKSFSSLSSMSTHLDDSKHNDLLLKKQLETDTSEYRAPYMPNFIESLIRNNIFPYISTQLECFTCQTVVPTKNGAEEHIKSQLHTNNRESASSFPKVLVKNKQLLLPESKTDLVIYFKNFIEKGPTDYYCHLCQSVFTSLTEVMLHIRTLKHCKLISDQKSESKIETESFYTLFFYELCIRNSIFGVGNKKLKCFACEGIHVSKKMVESHIEGGGHETRYDMKSKRKIVAAKPIVPNKTTTTISKIAPKCSNNDNKIPIDQNSVSSVEKQISKRDHLISECDFENQFLKCFENFIFVCDSYYSCYLCKKKMSSSSLMLLHIKDLNHTDLLRKRIQDFEISAQKFLYIPNFYEFLVRNHVFRHELQALKCLLCERDIIGYCNAEDHINGKIHKSAFTKMNSAISFATNGTSTSDAQIKLPETKENFARYFENFIEKRSKDYYCHLCCINLSSSEVMIHVENQEHLNRVKYYYKDEKIQNALYFSELCVRNSIFCCTVPGLKCFTCKELLGSKKQQIEVHVRSEKHAIERERILPVTDKSVKQKTILPQSDVISVEPVIEVNVTEIVPTEASKCLNNDKIIEINQNVVTKVDEHIDDDIQLIPICELEDKFLKYFDNFIFICDNFYCCNLCKKNLFTSSSMLSHINDSSHKNLLKKRRKEHDITEHKVLYTPNFYELLVRNNIFQLDSQTFRCLSCQYSMSEYTTTEEHINSQQHKNNLKVVSAIMSALVPVGSKDKSSSDAQITLPEKKDDFVMYFGNLIEKRSEDYLCHLCCTILSSWFEVTTHITVPNHHNLLQKRYVDVRIQNILYYSELCVRNSIFCCGYTQFKCFTCKNFFMSEKEIENHVKSQEHQSKYGLECQAESSTAQVLNLPQTKVESIKATEIVSTSAPKCSNNNKKIVIDQGPESTVKKQINSTDQSIPNYNLEDQFLKCYENFICIYDEKFYSCYLCKKIFPSSVLMILHTKDSNHINLLKKKRQDYGLSQDAILYTPNFYELLVRNNIFQFNSNAFKCLSCERVISGYICTEEHIKSFNHKKIHKYTLNELNAHISVTSGNKNKDAQIKLPETKKNFAQYFGNFIEKCSGDYYCHLCCINLSSSEVMIHIKMLEHLNRDKFYYRDKKIQDVFYYSELCVRNSIFSTSTFELKCFTCNKLIALKKEIGQHVRSEEHKTKYTLKTNVNSSLKQPLILPQPTVNSNKPIITPVTITKSSSVPETSDQFLVLFKNSIFMNKNNCFCNLCSISISKSDAMTHIDSRFHQNKITLKKKKLLDDCDIVSDNNFERLVRNNMFLLDEATIECYSCDCYFRCYKNVEEHIRGRRHKSVLKEFQITPVAEKTESPKLKSRRNKKQSKENKNTSSEVLSCDIYKYNDTKQEFLSCHVCKKRLKYRSILHVHLTGHFWKLFNDININDLMALVKSLSENVSVSNKQNVRQMVLSIADEKTAENSNTATKSKVLLSKKLPLKDKNQKCQGIRKITLDHLDVDENKIWNKFDIYKIDEEIDHMNRLSLSRICIINEDKIYCMICRKNVEYSLKIVYEHFRSIEHSYFLMQMVQDQMKFEGFPNELSDFKLAREMMEDKSDRHVVCFACNPVKPVVIPNKTEILMNHINSEKHQNKKAKLSNDLQQFIDNFNSRLERNWFNVQRYWCVICNEYFRLEHKFCHHLRMKKHHIKCQKFSRFDNLIYDFCSTCGVLFYGFKNTFVYHSNCQLHKFYIDRNCFFISRLPRAGAKLVTNAEENLMNKLSTLEKDNPEMKKREQLLLKHLKRTIDNYGDAKIYPFGSRVTGLGSMNSDLDIFIDCYDSYYKGTELVDVIGMLTDVEDLLKQKKEIWTIKRAVINCRIPIIKLIHNITGIDCDISFTNGLTTENSKLVKAYVDKYPPCKKLILFIRDWINACNVSGEDGISSYAIAWMVIYYLQTKFIVPSVAELIKIEGKSCVTGGWETGASNDFTLPDISFNYSFKDLLKGFFIMCAGFDYRNNILCPLLGRPIKKIDLIVSRKPSNLPEEMVPYKNYIKNKNAECFRSDSVMGVQDPFDLSHNLTKAVKKFVMHRFRTYCAMSANELIN